LIVSRAAVQAVFSLHQGHPLDGEAAPTRMLSGSPFFGRNVVGVHALGPAATSNWAITSAEANESRGLPGATWEIFHTPADIPASNQLVTPSYYQLF
jgi:hypothetical protein